MSKNKNNIFKLGRSIAQSTISVTNKETTTRTKRDNHNKAGNNYGNNSDSKDCCFSLMDLRSNFLSPHCKFKGIYKSSITVRAKHHIRQTKK